MIRRVCIVIFLLAATVLAADVSGTWKAEFITPDGTQRVNTFTFKVNADVVTGTVAGGQDETPLKEGRVAGDTISFTADRPWGKFVYKGKINGDEIRFAVRAGENDIEMTARRVK